MGIKMFKAHCNDCNTDFFTMYPWRAEQKQCSSCDPTKPKFGDGTTITGMKHNG